MSRDSAPLGTTILVDGEEVPALVGQSVAGALEAAGIRTWRTNKVDGSPRAPFCGMGVCYECELQVERSAETRACMAEVEPGLVIRTEGVARGRA
jgi:hypothetical protein